jgi:hypothetical protein
VLISLYDMDTSKIYVFGSKQYTDTELNEWKRIINQFCWIYPH